MSRSGRTPPRPVRVPAALVTALVSLPGPPAGAGAPVEAACEVVRYHLDLEPVFSSSAGWVAVVAHARAVGAGGAAVATYVVCALTPPAGGGWTYAAAAPGPAAAIAGAVVNPPPLTVCGEAGALWRDGTFTRVPLGCFAG